MQAHRTFTSALLLGLLGACGREEAAPTRAPACPTASPDTARGEQAFRSAVTRAQERNLPLLILVRPPHAACPAADLLEELLLATPALETSCVLVTSTGGLDADEPGRRLVRAARVRGAYPPLLVIATPQLDLLHVQTAGLMHYYDLDGRPLEADTRPLLTGDDIVALVKAALARKTEVDDRLEALAGASAPEGRLERAELLAARGRWVEAREVTADLERSTLSLQQARRLFDVLLDTEGAGQARELAESLLTSRPGEQGAAWLELRLLWTFPDRAEVRPLDRLRALIQQAQGISCRRLEASARALRVLILSASPAEAGPLLAEDLHELSSLDASVFDGHPVEGARVLAALLRAALLRQDYTEAERLLLALDRDYPDSWETARCRHGTLGRIRRHYDKPRAGHFGGRPDGPQRGRP